MKLDDMPKASRPRSAEDFAQERGGLVVRKMSAIAEDPSDQLGRTAAVALHIHIVVELHGQEIDVGQLIDESGVPGTKVGDIAERNTTAVSVARSVKTKTKGLATVVRQS
jgi:hypothetical protein